MEMSISAGVLILLLALLRSERFWHLSRRTMMLLWMVALARLLPGRLPMRKGIADPVFAWMRQVCGLHTGTVRQADGNAAGRMAPKAASFGTQGYPWIYLQEMAGFVCLE